MADVYKVHTAVHLLNGGCWECLYSGLFAQWQNSGMFI